MILAAKTGAALIQVKELLSHGEYLPWVKANMPISRQQCSKYIRLATEKPELLANGAPGHHLDINSELKLLSLDDDKAEEVRDLGKRISRMA